MPPDHKDVLLQQLSHVRATGESVELVQASETPEGGRGWWQTRMTPIRAEGRVTDVLIVARASPSSAWWKRPAGTLKKSSTGC